MNKFAVAAFGLVMASSFAYADRSVDELYPKTCTMCHAQGIANAPKTHDAAAWQPRLESVGGTVEGLVEVAKKGLNAMPPKGMCNDCTDGEFKALIEFMMKPAS